MAYTKQTWQNEVLSGVSADQALFTIKNSSGTIINDDVIIELKSTEVQAGSEFTADRMNHIEDGIAANSAAFDASTGHDHDGTNSKKIAYANVTNTPQFETSASNIKPDGTASAGNSGKVADAAHVHPEIRLLDNAGAHNSIWRGISLGTSVTTAQWEAISNGTFENLYIGDYWTINSVVWRIAAFDYYLATGDTACNTHHVVIVPDTNLYSHVMNDTDITTGGYVGSKMYTEGLADAKTAINNAFGSAHILSHRQYLCNAVTNGYPSGCSWYDSKVELMTEQSVYGGKVMSPMGNGATFVANYTVDKSQYPLFALNPHMISNRQYFWLRDVVSAATFAFVDSYGVAGSDGASGAGGVRPAFSIIG